MANLDITATFISSDVTAPTLSSPTGVATSPTTANGTVTSDEANGTLFAAVLASASGTPSKAEIESGGGNVLSRTQNANPVIGVIPVSFSSGMVASTSYKIAYFHRDAAGNESSISESSAFSTPAASTSDYPDTATAADWSAVTTLLTAWEADWATTASGLGVSTADQRVIRLTSPISGNVTLSGYSFANTSHHEDVIIRGTGPYTEQASFPYAPHCASHIAGKITVTNCSGVGLALMTAEDFDFTNWANFRMHRVSIAGRNHTDQTVPLRTVTSRNSQFLGCTDGIIYQCNFEEGNEYVLALGDGCDSLVFDECYIGRSANDYLKFLGTDSATRTNITFRRVVFGREVYSDPAVGAHTDFFQSSKGSSSGLLWWGCIAVSRPAYAGSPFGYRGQTVNQGEQTTGSNQWFEACIFASSFKKMLIRPVGGGTGNVARYNTVLIAVTGDRGDGVTNVDPEPSPSSGTFGWIGPGWDSDASTGYNIGCNKTAIGGASPGNTGPGGIICAHGDITTNGDAFDLSAVEALYTECPAFDNELYDWRPISGTKAHEDYSTPADRAGAWERWAEIIDDKRVPVNWPTGGPYHRSYDPTNRIGSAYTGTWDSTNGEPA